MVKSDQLPATTETNLPSDPKRFEIVAKDENRALSEYAPPVLEDIDLTDFGRGVPRFWVFVSFILCVALPSALIGWFLIAIASERYTSEFRVAVRSSDVPVFSGVGELMGLNGASKITNDSQVLVQYLKSRSVISDLENSIPIRQFYSRAGLDPLSSIEIDAPIERWVKHWNRFTEISFEKSNSTIVARFTAFSPVDAHAISQNVLIKAESYINTLSDQARKDALSFANSEVSNAETRVTDARLALAQLQDAQNILDPIKSGETAQALSSKLNEEIIRLRAVLATQRTQLDENAPSVRVTKNLIMGLESELENIGRQTTALSATNDQDVKPLTVIIREYQAITDELGYAERSYLSAISSLEAARIDASRKQIYLATVVAPSLPEEKVFPKPISGTLLAFGIALAVWLIGLISVYSIKEHR